MAGVGIPNTPKEGNAGSTGKRKAVRIIHHTERVSFPRDGKKAKAYFQNLKDEYSCCWCINQIQDTWQSETGYYQEYYGAMVEARNQAYARARHTDRITTIRDLHGRKRTCPEELSIQASGKKGEGVPDRKAFESCIMRYLSWMQEWNRKHGDHMHVLNVHISNNPPYRAIFRRVWDCTGENGLLKVSMTGALKEAGVPYPDQEAEESRYNNRKMTFDRMSRKVLYGYFEDAGIPVNWEPGIYTLRQALRVKEGAVFDENNAKEMLRQIMEVEEQAPVLDGDGNLPDAKELPDGSVLVPEEGYRLLKIRECLGGAYASRNQQAGERLLEALEEEQEANSMRAMQEGIRKNLELEYAALRIGLLRCGYYIRDREGEGANEGFPQ